MAKQLNVNLSFTADTEKAKAQIRELQNALTKITQNASKTSPLGLTEDVNSAIKKVTELQTILQKATTETGSLDLGQFNQELKKANLSAETIKSSLAALGPEGQAAFAKIAQSVSMAEIPLKRTNGLLAEFATTLKNTARWQLSSSILHGFIGSVQSAYRYAQDLNSSLNDIRIVTGQSTEQMAEFAKQANESAKALSATTTAYTDAALIFYQQGLSDDAVKERTDTVIKMSNVTGEAVKDVSSYMTAIWNNFDDGSESLEHYADVITALGAATASSSEEIAGGLEKFASIGKTVGLSYDYATAALATVVSATRQSEDVVGNAFKTIFSRIQGLKLGETLEDDVDLNKYSTALKAVGVEVVTSTGELRDLDNILDDLASKWDNLTSAQQTALAQTVAGTRQYAQFIALMGNWDSMTRNLEIAKGAEGSLQEQADIYAESWEAARKRVKASAQAIYDDLLDDQFFIKLTDAISKVLDGIHSVIESIGGLKGVIPIISSLLLKMFSGDIVNSMNNFMYNIQLMSKTGRQAIIDRRKEFNDALISMKSEMEDFTGMDLYNQRGQVQNELIEKTVQLNSLGKELTETEKEQLNYLMDINNAHLETVLQSDQELKNIQHQNEELKSKVVRLAGNTGGILSSDGSNILTSEELKNQLNYLHQVQEAWAEADKLKDEFFQATENGDDEQAQKQLTKLSNILDQIAPKSKDATGYINEFQEALDQLKNAKGPDAINEAFIQLENVLADLSDDSFDDLINGINGTDNKSKELIATIRRLKDGFDQEGHATVETSKKIDTYNKSLDNISNTIKKVQGTTIETSQAIVAMGQGFSSFAMYLNSINSLIDGFTNPDLSGIKRLTAIMTSLGMIINGITSTTKSFNTVLNWLNNITIKKNALDKQENANLSKKIILINAETGAKQKLSIQTSFLNAVSKIQNREQQQLNLKTGESISVEEFLNQTREQQIKTLANLTDEEAINIGVTKAETEAFKELTVASENSKKAISSNGYLLIIMAIAAALTSVIQVYDKINQTIKERNDKQLEEIKTLQESIKEHGELISSYEELISKMDNGEDVFNSLVDTTSKLTEAYNIQGASILTLSDNYKILANRIREARQEELEQNIENSNKAYQKAFESGTQFSLGEYFKNMFMSDALIATSLNTADKRYAINGQQKQSYFTLYGKENIQNALEAADLDYLYNLAEGFTFQHVIDYSDPEEVKDWLEKINTFIEEYEKSESNEFIRYNTGIYQQFLDLQKKLSEYESDINNEINEIYSSEIEYAFDKVSDKLNKDISPQELLDIIDDIKTSEIITIKDEDILNQYINNYIKGISEISDSWDKIDLANRISKKTGEELNNILNIIEGYNTNQLATIEVHLNTLTAADELQDWVNQNKIILDFSEDKYAADSFKSIINQYDSKKGFSEVDTNTIFNDENLVNRLGVDKESFYLADQSNQLTLITNAWIKSSKAAEENKEKTIEALDAEYKKLLEIQAIQTDNSNVEKALERVKQYGFSQLELDRILNKLISDTKDLNEAEEKKLEIFLKNENITKDQLITYLKVNNTYENVEESIEDLKSQLASYEDEVATTEEKLVVLNDLEEAHNLVIDNIQTNYKDLVGIIDNYNQTGIWTIDNAQKLVEMDNQYVAALQFENGQLKLNEQIFKDLTTAKLEELKSTVLLTMQEELESLALENVTDANKEATEADIYHQKIVTEGIDAAKAGAAAWREYAASLSESFDNDEIKKKKAKEITDAAYNRLQAIQGSIDEIKKGGTLMRAAMGVSSGTSSSKSKLDTKDLKEYLDEFDRFYPIKKAIEDVSDALSDLSKQQQHLAGKALANSLKEQNKLLQNQAELYKKLLTEQEDYRNELAGTLGSFGMTFDAATGNITNYAAATQSALDKYNQAIIAYNTSAQDEVAKATLKTAEDEYNVFKNTLSKYQSILKDIEDTTNNLDDIFYKQIENNFKAFEVEIKLDLDIEDARRKVLDFIQEINTDFKKVYKTTAEWTKLFDVAAKKVETFTEQEGTLSTDLKELKQIADIIDDPNYNYGSSDALFASKSDAINKYKEITETLMSDSKELYSLYESSWQNYLSAVDEVKDQWNDVVKDFDKINSTLDHYSKLIELLYGGEETVAGRNYLDELYGAQANNSLAKQTALKEEILALQKEYDEILAAGADQNDEDVKRIAEAIEDASDELNSEIESYLQTIQSKLTNSIKSIMSTADKAMTQDVGINKVIERWNDAKEAAEGYYDETERVYQLQKAENDWKDLISSTSRIKDQQYLKQIMDSQLKNLKEKTKLSEYDIALAEKELEVQKAYIALQNAQNNKNSMKLVRNQQGNWTYQYVADQNEVLDKQQDFLDALNQKYEFVKEKSAETTEKVMNLYQTANEKLTALLQEYTNADETRRAEIKEEYDYFYEYYYGSEGVIVQAAKECADIQNDVTSTMMQLLEGHYEVNEKNFEEMTSEQQRLVEELKDTGISNFGELSLALGDKESGIYGDIYQHAEEALNAQNTDWQNLAQNIIDSWAEDPDKNVRDVIRDSYDQIMDKVKEYDGAIKASEEASGVAWGNIKIDIDATTRSLDTLIQKTDSLSNFKTSVDAISTAWLNVKSGIEAAVSALENYLKLLKEDTGKPQTPDYSSATVGTGSGTGSSGNGNNGGNNNTKDTETKNIDRNSGKTYYVVFGIDGRNLGAPEYYNSYSEIQQRYPSDRYTIESQGTEKQGNNTINRYTITSKISKKETTNKNIGGGSAKNKVMMAYASGGYTGDWNSSEGRIGVLHEKELVLNKEDTSNILNAVNLVRGISNISDLVSKTISSNLAGMALSLTGLGSNTINRNVSTNNSSNNVFNINAEFPNAENVEEIREAILSLPNLAAQYLAQK